MRKITALLFACLLIPQLLGAQEEGVPVSSAADGVEQVLVPKEVFVGDTAQINYTFRSAVDFFAMADSKRIAGDKLSISVSQAPFIEMSEQCTVSKVELLRKDLTYTLVITFVPWYPGALDFGSFDLNVAASGKKETATQTGPFIIDLTPVNIASLVERTGTTTLKPPLSPYAVPGTNYILWSFIIIIVLLLVGAGFVIAKLPQVIQKFQNWKERMGFFRNTNSTCKKLHKLLNKKDCNDITFASIWQRIMRNYLEKRFGCSFASVPASQVAATICQLTGETLSQEQEDIITELASYFRRTDYIRFAVGSVDSELLPVETHQALFAENERAQLVQHTEQIVRSLEDRDTKKEDAK